MYKWVQGHDVKNKHICFRTQHRKLIAEKSYLFFVAVNTSNNHELNMTP